MILARILCLVCGYLFGIFQTSYIYGRCKGIDIREHGSGNAGTTNALRVLGAKAGLIVFIGDVFKACAATFLTRFICMHFFPDEIYLFIAYTGIGVIIGHNFPFYLGFKGGKGIAATAGIILGFLDPVIIFTCLFTFIIIVAVTRYVSLGSIVIVIELAVIYAVSAFGGKYPFDLHSPTSQKAMYESVVVVIIMAIMGIWRHKANIIRLINHEENKIFQKKDK